MQEHEVLDLQTVCATTASPSQHPAALRADQPPPSLQLTAVPHIPDDPAEHPTTLLSKPVLDRAQGKKRHPHTQFRPQSSITAARGGTLFPARHLAAQLPSPPSSQVLQHMPLPLHLRGALFSGLQALLLLLHFLHRVLQQPHRGLSAGSLQPAQGSLESLGSLEPSE